MATAVVHTHVPFSSSPCSGALASGGRGPCSRGGRFSGVRPCYGALSAWGREEPPARGGKKILVSDLWREFYVDPSQWWDNRFEKGKEGYPHFTHKTTKGTLWLNGNWNPPWVEAELAAVVPGTVQVDLFTWNKRLTRCAKAGHYKETMQLFRQMQEEGIIPDKFTFLPVLKACSKLQVLKDGRFIHAQIIKYGCESDPYVGSCLVNMYTKCGSIEDACGVFKKISTCDLAAWNAMILGYVKCGQGQKAMDLFHQMQREGMQPDTFTYVGVVNACSSLGALQEGGRIHEQIIQSGWASNVFVSSSLVDMYVKCGSIKDACTVFNKMPSRDVVCWNTMILGYVKYGQGEKALKLFEEMLYEGVEPSPITFVGVLNACASIPALEGGRRVHKLVIQKRYDSNVSINNSLVDMYAKCGIIEEACTVFNKIVRPDAVSWNAMILGHVKCGQGQKALELYRRMERVGVEPTATTFVGVLNACASVASLEEGRRVHEQIIQKGADSDVFVGSSLVDMYSKCGSLEDAWKVFKVLPIRDVVSWNAMLAGYATHGHAEEAIECFKQMVQVVKTSDVTFMSLLSACSHGGLLNEGLHYFESMAVVYGISSTVEHYACVVDLLGRGGRLLEAEELITTMPYEPSTSMLSSLLGACKCQGNLELGERVAERALKLGD